MKLTTLTSLSMSSRVENSLVQPSLNKACCYSASQKKVFLASESPQLLEEVEEALTKDELGQIDARNHFWLGLKPRSRSSREASRFTQALVSCADDWDGLNILSTTEGGILFTWNVCALGRGTEEEAHALFESFVGGEITCEEPKGMDSPGEVTLAWQKLKALKELLAWQKLKALKELPVWERVKEECKDPSISKIAIARFQKFTKEQFAPRILEGAESE